MSAATEVPAGAVVRRAADAHATWAVGGLFERLLTSADTAGALGLSVTTQLPGAATPLHVHSREAECFYVLDGTLTYRVGDHVARLAAGDVVWLPAGVPHAFRVTGDRPARFLALTVPDGLLDLYDAVGTPALDRRPPRPDEQSVPQQAGAWVAAAPEFGITVVGPPLPPED